MISLNIKNQTKEENELNITISSEKVNECFSKSIKSISSSTNIHGFRKGKVPESFIERKYSTHLQENIKKQLVQEGLEKLWQDKSLKPLNQPKIDSSNKVEKGKGFIFSVTYIPYPKLKLVNYKNLELELEESALFKEKKNAVEETLEYLASAYGKYEEIKKGTWQIGDILEADYSFEFQDKDLKKEEQKKASFSIEENGIIPEFDKHFLDLKINEEKSLSLTFPKDYKYKEEYKGKKAKVSLKILGVKRKEKSKIDDKLAELQGMKNLDELKGKIKENLENQKKEHDNYTKIEKVNNYFLENTEILIPKNFFDSEYDSYIKSLKEEQKKEKDWEKKAKKDLEKNLKTQFIITKFIEEEKLSVEQTEVQSALLQEAQRRMMPPEKLFKVVQSNKGYANHIYQRALEEKLWKLILGKVKFKIKKGVKNVNK